MTCPMGGGTCWTADAVDRRWRVFRALKVLPQLLQKYRFSPLARPRITAPSVAQCGQPRAAPIRSLNRAWRKAVDNGELRFRC